MAEPLRALLIKPGGVVRLVSVSKTGGVVNLTYASQKLLSAGKLVILSVENAKCSQPRRSSDLELKQISTIVVDGKKVDSKSCFEMQVEGKIHVMVPM
jgi:hypothetical protein